MKISDQRLCKGYANTQVHALCTLVVYSFIGSPVWHVVGRNTALVPGKCGKCGRNVAAKWEQEIACKSVFANMVICRCGLYIIDTIPACICLSLYLFSRRGLSGLEKDQNGCSIRAALVHNPAFVARNDRAVFPSVKFCRHCTRPKATMNRICQRASLIFTRNCRQPENCGAVCVNVAIGARACRPRCW